MRARSIRMTIVGTIVGMLALAPAYGLAGTAAQRCAVAKNRAAADKIAGKLRCVQRALAMGTAVRPECLARVEGKFRAEIARAEGRGGCVVVGDAQSIEDAVDACVGQLAALTPATTSTTTTVTTSSSCPPTTAFYCGVNSPICGIPSICPAGMTCETGADGCTCAGTAPACGSLRAPMCRWGVCPIGQSCVSTDGGGCPPLCGCQ